MDFDIISYKEYNEKGRMRRVPDILPVRMQDILYSRKPELREQGPLVFQAERIPFPELRFQQL